MPDRRICIYDASAKTVLGGNPANIPDLGAPLDADQKALLDQAGALLAQSTAELALAVKTAAGAAGAETLLLAFLPTVLDPAMPEAMRANLPVNWAAPAFDTLQLEDYDWVTDGKNALRAAARGIAESRLNYSRDSQHYLAGFVLRPEHAAGEWARIDAAATEAVALGVAETFVWALPQVCRDGFTRLPGSSGDETMQSFDDVLFPLALGRDASVTPEFSTNVTITASGFERRNSLWSDARLRFDVGPGVRSEAELGELIAFFRARRGQARGFRLRDPSDFSSNAMTAEPTPADQLLGFGNGAEARFPLVKLYGDSGDAQRRRITRPRSETLRVSVDGVETRDFTLAPQGVVVLATAPATGVPVRAGFVFDVPVRFAEDRLDISGAEFAAGEAPSVPLIELREDA